MNARILLKTAALLAALSAVPAHAQLFRAYLSPTGSDSNPCTLAAPCRLLPAALGAVASGGEIWMLASANYNTATVNVNKSVTILAIPGAVGSVVATNGTAALSIASAGVSVTLRNLVVAPTATSPGPDGVVMTAGSKLSVENCVLARLSNRALYVGTAATVRVVDSIFRDNLYAMYFEGGAKAEVAKATVVGASNGISLYGDVPGTITTASISESMVSGGGYGVVAISRDATAEVHASVSRSTITGNAVGFIAQKSTTGGPSSVTISRNFVGGNFEFFEQIGTGSLMRSMGDNHVDDTNSTGILTTLTRR